MTPPEKLRHKCQKMQSGAAHGLFIQHAHADNHSDAKCTVRPQWRYYPKLKKKNGSVFLS